MTDSDFVQERAYIYEYSPEEIEILKRKNNGAVTQSDKDDDDECHPGIIIIDILGE